MSLLTSLERRLGRHAIPHLTLLLVMGQALSLLLSFARPELLNDLTLVPARVAAGEYWRLLSFMVMPPSTHPLWAAFALYVFYLMGTALEQTWGEFRYNLYLFIAYLATLTAAFCQPAAGQAAGNGFIGVSVLLAFAYLYPDFEFLIFFILPVKVKYLAMITWAGLALVFVFAGSMLGRLLILASVTNFLIFFGRDLLQRGKMRQRRRRYAGKQEASAAKPLHCCTVCGITEKEEPDMDFRVCTDCTGGKEYCEAHCGNHQHC